jgi:ParB-like chromosome segregation protein Spo0J
VPADPSKPDPAFDALMESLEKDKQNEPGLITRDGILVNGNTRRAALKQLGVTSIRVGVLPESTTWADIHSIELALQLRPDRRREYSYINHLLAVEEQIGQSIPPAAVARNFRTTTPSIERDLWILNQIRDLIRRSQNSGHALRLVDFENAKERFFELYRAYSKEVAKNKEKADLLRENRLAAIVLEFSKTDVRHIEPEFQERYLDPRLPEDQRSESSAQTVGVAIPGLGRAVKPTGTRVVAARELTRRHPQSQSRPSQGRPGLACAIQRGQPGVPQSPADLRRGSGVRRQGPFAPQEAPGSTGPCRRCSESLGAVHH